MVEGHARRHTWMAYTSGLRSLLDLQDAALTAPGALLVQQCARDTLLLMAGMRRGREAGGDLGEGQRPRALPPGVPR